MCNISHDEKKAVSSSYFSRRSTFVFVTHSSSCGILLSGVSLFCVSLIFLRFSSDNTFPSCPLLTLLRCSSDNGIPVCASLIRLCVSFDTIFPRCASLIFLRCFSDVGLPRNLSENFFYPLCTCDWVFRRGHADTTVSHPT